MSGSGSGTISSRDEGILDFIFNPQAERPTAPASQQDIEPALKQRPSSLTDGLLDELQLLETEAIKLADANKLKEGYDVLTAVIAREPLFAPAYNNRAQVLRLLQKDDLALLDLDKAIELAYDVVTLRQGLTQRGLLHKLKGNELKAFEDLERAGKLGSDLARKEAVSVNPYAQLCGNMVAQVMQSYKSTPQ